MRAVVYRGTGEADVLEVVEREPGEPGQGEVRVRVVRSAVNPTDWKIRAGLTGAMAGAEVVPNQDGSGVVDAVGSGVADIAVGDRVGIMLAAYQRPTGTAQEATVVPAERAFVLPDGVGFDAGADVGVPGLTAHRALTTAEDWPDRLAPESLRGAAVLVAGGAGAVGNAAIQLARWAGATVLTTVSGPDKAALATAAGAHHVVNYREQDVVTAVRDVAPDGVDIVVEVAPAQNLAVDLQLVRPRGTISVYANNGGDEVLLRVRETFSTNVRLQFVFLYTVGAEQLRAGIDDVLAAMADGGFGVGEEHGLPLLHFPLEDTAAAHRAVEEGAVGKVLIDVSPE